VGAVKAPTIQRSYSCNRSRQSVSTRSVPVILLSARAGDEAKIEGLQMGADDYLVKPFSARELRARVAANIELARSFAT
jgi:DNA-binding response OmpR family regulator